MGDIFCLVILESGSRRKLKLQTGTYDELQGSLAGIVELDPNNTLVQIYDSDLDDFVDLLPGDVVPNRAKLRVIQKASSAWCTPPGNAAISSPLPQSTLQIVSASSVAASPFVKKKSKQPSIFPYSGDELREDYSTGAMVASEPGGSEDAFMRLLQVPDALRAMLPNYPAADVVGNLCDVDVVPAQEQDRNDYLKFTLPSFGTWCDIVLMRKSPLTTSIRRHIINTIFNACFKITLYPTRQLYRTAIDALCLRYPHVISGPNDWQRWCFALRSKYKNTRKKFPEPSPKPGEPETRESPREGGRKEGRKRTLADVKQVLAAKRPWLADPDEPLNPHGVPECVIESDEPEDSEAAPFQTESEQGDKEEEPYSSPNISNAIMAVEDDKNDITVADLLRMCTDESAAEKLAEKAASKSLPRADKSVSKSSAATSSGGVPHLRPEKPPRLSVPTDYLKFKLPPFTAIQDALNAKEPVTGRMCRQIINSLYSVCCKITLYPSSRLYRFAVDCLLTKYPHLQGSDEEMARQLWIGRLRGKFKNARRHLPDDMLNMYELEGKWSSVVARRLMQKNANDKTETVRRASRAVYLDRKLLATKLKTSQHGDPESSAAAVDSGSSELSQVLESKRRHDRVKEMPIEQAIVAFPCYRQESSLLAEFKALWKVDIAECFEKGIKRLFLVLMNTGTPQEIMAISEVNCDILLVVLDAIAKRCKEKMSALLAEDAALPAPCLLKRPNGTFEVFVEGYFLFTASSLLGGICALFASFWVFHVEYPKDARSILTFLEHAFLNLNYTKPTLKTWELINVYRSSSPWHQEKKK
ncbi:uncharacterized protein LOC144101449 isoform X2 [Amblyomma americanum]